MATAPKDIRLVVENQEGNIVYRKWVVLEFGHDWDSVELTGSTKLPPFTNGFVGYKLVKMPRYQETPPKALYFSVNNKGREYECPHHPGNDSTRDQRVRIPHKELNDGDIVKLVPVKDCCAVCFRPEVNCLCCPYCGSAPSVYCHCN